MALRKYTNPRDLDLSPGLQDILRRNGMQAHMSMLPNGQMQLIVLGHDSPAITYNLNDRQVEDLMAWGSNYANKKAYNTFTSIVKNDFHMPDNFVSARNAFGRVAMGLHGYRMGSGEYGIPYYRPFSRSSRGWGGDFVGWTPGFHMRRIGGQPFMAGGGIMTPVRPDGRVKPGELNAGGYGFYYKGQQQLTRQDVLDNVLADGRIQPVKAAPRPVGQAIPYSEKIWEGETNGFTNEKFQEVLRSHGIIIDAEKKTLTIQSSQVPIDLRYDLTDEELQTLTVEGVGYPNGKTVEERLAVINNRIMVETPDFANPITKEMLESKNLVNLQLTEEAKKSPQIAAFYEQQERFAEQQRLLEESRLLQQEKQQRAERIAADPNAIDGLAIRDILGNRGWFQPVNNGREMVVGEIRVDKVLKEPVTVELTRQNKEISLNRPLTEAEIQALGTNAVEKENLRHASEQVVQRLATGAPFTFIMSAIINGETVTHEISQKDYEKFLALDDAHRLKLFDKLFSEVEIKHASGTSRYDDMYLGRDGHVAMLDIEGARSNYVDGAALQDFKQHKGFYREIAHGREVEVGEIRVDKEVDGKYKMTAVIDGKSITHEISQKQYDKFLAVDDYQRMKLFSKIFDEVDIKTRPGEGTNIGAAILAALVVTGEMLADPLMHHGPGPEIYKSRMPGTTYYKPGVVSPAEVAAANFENLDRPAGRDFNESRGMGI